MNNIKYIRKDNGLSQSAFAKLFNISQQTVSNWEKGITDMDLSSLDQISEYFGLSIDYILGKTQSKRIKKTKNSGLCEDSDFIKIPVLSADAASNPINSIEKGDIDGYAFADAAGHDDNLLFGIKVDDNGMEPRLSDGDLAVIATCDITEDGDVAAVAIGDCTILRRVKFEQAGIWLIGTNPSFEPVYYTAAECEELPITIIGRIVQVLHYWK